MKLRRYLRLSVGTWPRRRVLIELCKNYGGGMAMRLYTSARRNARGSVLKILISWHLAGKLAVYHVCHSRLQNDRSVVMVIALQWFVCLEGYN